MSSPGKGETKKRGRPRKFEEQATMERLRRVFAARGYAEASLDDLTAATGLNRPSIYGAFGDKEAIYLRSLMLYGARLGAVLAEALGAAGPVEDRLDGFFVAFSGLCREGEPPPGCMLAGAAAAAHHPSVAAAARELRGQLTSAFESFFRICLARRELPADPSPTLRAQWTLAVMDTIGQRARLGETQASLVAFARESLALICRI